VGSDQAFNDVDQALSSVERSTSMARASPVYPSTTLEIL